MAEICDLCAKRLQNKILLNDCDKNLIDMLLNWLKYKHDNKLYENVCEECFEEISRIHRFMDVIKASQMIYINIKSNDKIINNNIELSANASLTSLNKRTKVAPKRFRDGTMILTMKPVKIITNNKNNTEDTQLIAKLYMQDQPQMILADVSEVKINDTIKCNFTCKFCQREYDKELYLKQHVAEHLQSADKENNLKNLIYDCVVCKKAFKKQYPMRRHFKNSHNTEKLYKCEQCSAAFKNRYNLSYHVARHNNDKPFECSVCNKSFILHYELLLHRRTHTGEKPHKCLGCNHSFAHRSNLLKHHRLCSKFKKLNQSFSTQTANNQDNKKINDGNDKASSTENLANTFNAINKVKDDGLTDKTDSNLQICQQQQQEQEQIKQTVVKKMHSSNSNSLLNCNIAMKCNEIRTRVANSEERMPGTKTTNAINNYNNDAVKELTCENFTDLRITKKSFVSQTKELDQKFLIKKVEILPPLNVTTKSTLPIQNLIQMPSKYKYQCMNCWKYFKHSSTFKKHVKSHTEDQAYQCRNMRSQILSDPSNYSPFRSLRGSHRKASQASPLAKSPLSVTCLSPTCSIVSDPDPDGREIMQMIKSRENENPNDCNSSSDGNDDNSLSSSCLENTMWEEALDKVLFQPAIMQNIRNNLGFT